MKGNSIRFLFFCVSIFIIGLVFVSQNSYAFPPAPAPDNPNDPEPGIYGPPGAFPPDAAPDIDEDWMDELAAPFPPCMALNMGGAGIFAVPAASPPGPPTVPERMERVHRKIETMRMWRLTEELNLTEEKGAKLFPVLNKYNDKRAALGIERRKLLTALRDLANDQSPSDAKLKETLDALEVNGSSMDQLKKDELKELKAILAPYEQAKFIIFNEQFEREMRQTIERVRGRNAVPGPRGRSTKRP
ncbi:MAG: hypothetical protein QME66_07610 [Candidatus Eisenbacteria bacterium]|nr:hypothetical protein [Candidatus Eisenbacteria bacterium]